MTVFDELIAPVMPIIQQIEHDRPKHHNEDLTWSAFTQILLYFFTKDLISGLTVTHIFEKTTGALPCDNNSAHDYNASTTA
jgi:hypothetical protein